MQVALRMAGGRAVPQENSRRRGTVTVRANASRRFGRGENLEPERLNAGRQLGSGSFGECYRGTLVTDDGEVEVVLKRVKARVQGADEMHQAEHLINVLASKAAGEAVAPFLGYALVEQPSGRLTKGLWLVWAYEGDRTLAYYLKRRDCERCLAADLGVEESQAVPTAMKHIFECLLALHNVGIVHRDIKPANIVFDESARRFRLIDLGAAACLRTGTNYKPAETILDPCYCPPEEYVLPTGAPHLADQGTRLRTVITPVLWTQHRPDCFDTYSAGIVLMQLSLPFLRTTSSLRTFNGALARCNHDLEEWRVRSGLPARQTTTLDANNSAGWDLAASLLRPREVVTDEAGGVKFLNTGRAPRLSASAALKHSFIRQAGVQAAPANSSFGAGGRSRSGSGSTGKSIKGSHGGSRGGAAEPTVAKPAKKGGGGLMSMWGALKNKVFDLEARVLQEATATEVQTGVVQKLRSDVAAGKASAADLRREESALDDMQRTLESSVKEMNVVFTNARSFLSAVLGSGTGADKAKPAAKASRSASSSASSGKAVATTEPDRRMPKWAAKEVPLVQVDPTAARQVAAAAAASSRRSYNSAEDEEQRTKEASKEAGTAAGAAVSGFLRLTGNALTGLASFAASVSEQMEKNAQQAAAEAAAQKKAATAYLGALQALQPALTGSAGWEEAAPRIPESPDYAALSGKRREQVFRAYVEVVSKAEATARAKAQAAFQELMVASHVAADSRYADFQAAHSVDERFAALATEAERVAAFEGFAGQLRTARDAAQRKEAEAAEAAARAAARAAQRLAEAQAAKERAAARAALKMAQAEAAEAAYRGLLQEQEAVITTGVEYAQLKRMMWTDPRFDVVPEYRRKQLFGEYVAILDEAGLLAGEGNREAAVATVATSAEQLAGLVGAEEGASQEQMEFLRREQARLKSEYSKMEAKLRSMEQRLQLGATAVSGLPPHTEDDSGVTFRFGGTLLPSAADLSKQVAANGSSPANLKK